MALSGGFDVHGNEQESPRARPKVSQGDTGGSQLMESPTGIIPEALMYPHYKAQVVQMLYDLPLPGHEKVQLLYGWAKTVGCKIGPALRDKVEHSGTDFRDGIAACGV